MRMPLWLGAKVGVIPMPEFVTSITSGIKQTWSGLNKTQQRVVLAGGVIALAVLIAIVMYSTRGPVYEILWSNLIQPTQAP